MKQIVIDDLFDNIKKYNQTFKPIGSYKEYREVINNLEQKTIIQNDVKLLRKAGYNIEINGSKNCEYLDDLIKTLTINEKEFVFDVSTVTLDEA